MISSGILSVFFFSTFWPKDFLCWKFNFYFVALRNAVIEPKYQSKKQIMKIKCFNIVEVKKKKDIKIDRENVFS